MRIAFHLSQIQANEIRKALHNIKNLREAQPEAEIHAVSNTSAVTMTKEGSPYAENIKELINDYDVTVKACENSIQKTDMEEEDLIEDVELVGSGVAELSRLQNKSFGYIKP